MDTDKKINVVKNAETSRHSWFHSLSGRLDSNQRPLRPERSALPGCATARKSGTFVVPRFAGLLPEFPINFLNLERCAPPGGATAEIKKTARKNTRHTAVYQKTL